MPAKPTGSSTSTKPQPTAAKTTAKASKASEVAASTPAPAIAEPVKTVKLSRSGGAHAAQVTRRTAMDMRVTAPLADRDRLIAEAAYYRAEARGFALGDDQSDWFAAAQDVDAHYRFEN